MVCAGAVNPTSRGCRFQLAVNVPLCDILPAKRGTSDDNGPVEVHAGSHNWTPAFGEQTLAWGGVECKPVHMRKGDALIRDVRGLHRGTANYSPTPRCVPRRALRRGLGMAAVGGVVPKQRVERGLHPAADRATVWFSAWATRERLPG